MKKILLKYKNLPIQAKAAIWFLFCSFMQKGISVITTPIFTRVLSTSEYGEFNVFNSWEGIITVIISLNLYYGVYSQGLVKFEEDRKIFSSSMQGLSLTLTIIWLFVYLLFKNFFNNILGLNTTYVLFMILLIWLSSIFQFWSAEKRVDYDYKKLVIITIISSILNPVISLLFIMFFENNVLARILGIFVVSFFFYFWMFFDHMNKGKVFFNKKYWIYALGFNIPLIPHYLSQTVLNSSDRIMIDKIVDSSSAGIYSLAYSISSLMILFNIALSQTLTPWIYRKIKDKDILSIAPIAYFSLILISFFNILLIGFAPEILRFFAPIEYYDAIWVIPPVAMSVYFLFAYDLFAKFEFYYEKTGFIAIATFSGALLNLILNYIFINKYGYIAAGYTTLLCYILYALLHYFFMNKVCKNYLNNIKPYNSIILLVITMIFLFISFILMFCYKNTFIRYSFIIFLFMIFIFFYKKIIICFKKLLDIKINSR